MRDLVLIVDDVEINRMILREILVDQYDVIEAQDGEETLDILFKQNVRPTAILLDIIMPGIDGFEVLRAIKNHAETHKIPVLFITAADSDTNETRGLKAGAADYVSKPFNPDVVMTRLDSCINLMRYQTELEGLVEKKTAEVTKTYEQTLEVLATIIEYRSLESGEHIRRTTMLTQIMVNEMLKYPNYREILLAQNYESIVKASALHDIGKIGIPDNILLKPGRLTDEEFEIMRTHTLIGRDIIDSILRTLPDNAMYLKYCREICYYHHERWDGKGYPTKLKGEEIPISARILSIVDVFDALVNQRCYKPPFSYEEATNIIIEGSGTQFDPELVEVFLKMSDAFWHLEESLQD
jgi:putative two-component system response regulator